MNRMLLAAVVLAALLPQDARPETPTRSVAPIRVTRSDSDGVIVTIGERWRPTPAIVEELETRLPEFVQTQRARPSSPLSEYKRQYWGAVDKGREVVIVTFYHQTSRVVTEGSWLRALISVAGGGDRYLKVRYDVATKTLYDFWINAPE